jgi:hypothetical protein
MAGPAHNRVDAARRSGEAKLVREALEMIQDAHTYLNQMLRQYPEESFFSMIGPRSRQQLLQGSAWRQLLEELEAKSKGAL